jgi:hypothetical protein
MLVSFATGVVADQALPSIEFKTEFSQTRQRDARNLRYHHLCRLIPRHPDRQLRQRAIWLADNQGDFITMPDLPRSNNYLATTRMKAVPDRNLTRLIVGIMSLLRQLRVRSSTADKPDHGGLCREAFCGGRQIAAA